MKLFAGTAVILAAALPASAQVAPTGSWAMEQSEEFFADGSMVTDGTHFYLLGGGGAFPGGGLLRRYDPAANTWVRLKSMSVGTLFHAASVHGGRIYSFGGLLESDPGPSKPRVDTIQAYTISTDTWDVLDATLGEPRSQMMAATLDGAIYLVGGSPNHDEFEGVTFVFDPVGETVTARASLPLRVFYTSTLTAVPGLNRLYVIGGSDGGTGQINYEYDPQADTWTRKTFIRDTDGTSQPCSFAASFEIRNRVYIVGGSAGTQTPENQTFEYTPWRDRWVRRASMIVIRYRHGAVAINGKGYVYGGHFNGAFNSGEEFTPPILNDAPIAHAGADQTLECTSTSGAEVALDGSLSIDYDPEDSITYSWTGPFGTRTEVAPTITLPLGVHSVTLTVTDEAGVTASDTVVITVRDTTAPVIDEVTATPDSLTPPNRKMRDVALGVTATDIGDPKPVSQIISVTSNQPVGNEADWEITGALTLKLRAERSGGETRVYTVTVRSSDASGNSSTAQVTVTVPH